MKIPTDRTWLKGVGTIVLALFIQSSWAQQQGSHDHDEDSAAHNHAEHQAEEAGASAQGGMQMRGEGQGMMSQEGGKQGMQCQNQEEGQGMMRCMQQMQQQRAGMSNGNASANSLAGQDAFAAIKEVVTRLQNNPDTDWNNVNIDALREHLIDMHHVTLYADVETVTVDDGARYTVTGADRTLAAILNMVPLHANQIGSEEDWKINVHLLENGVELTVTSDSPDEVLKIRGLGFMGFLVTGDHHDEHHLMMAGAGGGGDTGHSH